MMFILSKKKLNKLFFLFLVFLAMSSNQVFAADKNCVKCDPSKVAGSPDASLGGLDKVVVAMAEKNVKSFKTPDGETQSSYCAKFRTQSNDGTVKPLLRNISEAGYSVEDVLSAVKCDPTKISREKNRIPAIQYIAEDSITNFDFPEEIYNYLKENKNLQGWKNLINVQNTKGMTLLDYMKYVYEKCQVDSIKSNLNTMFKFVCANGGELSYYKNLNCSDGISI